VDRVITLDEELDPYSAGVSFWSRVNVGDISEQIWLRCLLPGKWRWCSTWWTIAVRNWLSACTKPLFAVSNSEAAKSTTYCFELERWFQQFIYFTERLCQ
jgi:hypothetical protein